MPIKKKWEVDNTWTLFLDRDGVINERIFNGYILNTSEFKFIEGVKEALSLLKNHFNLSFVVTNQQGIAKALMTERNLLDIHAYMCDQILQTGGKIDKCYFASNMRDAENDIRKPKSAMALMAKQEFPEIDFQKSIMVGDTDSDIHFGKNIGMKTVRIKTEEVIGVDADYTVKSLYEFAKMINNEI